MRRRRRRHSSPSPALPLEDVLLRLPPLPSALPRASLVCKRWRGILSDPRFLGRYRRHHRRPPLLGFMTRWEYGMRHEFVPLPRKKPDRIPPARFAVPQELHPSWGMTRSQMWLFWLRLLATSYSYLSQCGSEEFLKEMAGIIPSIMSTEISILQAGELGGNGWI